MTMPELQEWEQEPTAYWGEADPEESGLVLPPRHLALLSPAEQRLAAIQVIGALHDEPLQFDRTILGRDPWEKAQEFMAAIAKPRARVAVKGCHASGKTHGAAGLVLWWVSMGGMCLTSAPTGTQVRIGLWHEIHAAYNDARFPIGGRLTQKELKLTNDAFAIGLSTNQGVRFQGFHGRVLIVLDEAPGVLADIWPAISGIRAGGDVRLLVLGNPILASGPFYDAFTIQSESWETFTISAFDTPNLKGVEPESLLTMNEEELSYAPRSYLATRIWAKEMLEDAGQESSVWESRVDGNFPSQSPDSLVPLSWLDEARKKVDQEELLGDPPKADEDWWAGIDVAGGGEDETVLAVRHGGVLEPGFPKAWKLEDCRYVIEDALEPYKERKIHLNVDSIGIGHYLVLHLRSLGFTTHAINVGIAARNTRRFLNFKAEAYWALREWFQQYHVAGLRDERTISQLTGIRYMQNPRGQILIEPKEKARERGVKSPDRAEAIMLCFARPYGITNPPLSPGHQPRPKVDRSEAVPRDLSPAEVYAAQRKAIGRK